MALAIRSLNAQTTSFFYCGGNVDIWTEGFWTTDFNAGFGFYQATVQEVGNPLATFTFSYVNGQGGSGGPYLGSMTGLLPGKNYQIYYQVKNLIGDPWGPPGPICQFTTVNKRQFLYCGNNNLNINAVGMEASDNNVSYNYYRFEFSNDTTFSEHIIIGSPLSNKFSMELNPTNKAPVNAPAIDQVNGIQYSKIYYARVKVKINIGDNWSPPGPVCTFTTYCPGGTPVVPLLYWQMENTVPGGLCYSNNGYNVVRDIIRDQEMAYTANLTPGPVGNCKVESLSDDFFDAYTICSTNQIPAHQTNGFTCEFLIKPDKDNLESTFAINFGWQTGFPLLNFSENGFNFNIYNPSNVNQGWFLGTRLNDFPDIYSFEYFLDGNFHHIAYVYNGVTQKLQIWIDGKLPVNSPTDNIYFELHDATMAPQIKFPADLSTNFAGITSCLWDEFALYDQALTPELIYQHYIDMTKGNHYNYCTNYTSADLPVQPTPQCFDLPTTEKAPMSGNTFSISASNQLKSYPLPRFESGFNLKRNVNFTDLSQYFSADYSIPGSYFLAGTFDKSESFKIDYEMYKNWNYYYHLETPTNIYSGNTATVTVPAYEAAANYIATQATVASNNINHVSTSIFWPFVLGTGCYGSLPSNADATCSANNGITQATRIQSNLLNAIGNKKLNYIVENGEAYNACGSALTIGVAQASSIQKNVEDAYKSQILNPANYTNPGQIASAEYSIYRHYNTDFTSNLSTICEYALWSDLRTQVKIGTKHYSTEDLYTVPVSWDRGGYAASHGINAFLESRAYEVSAGDDFCAPFVNCGFSSPDVDMRASQYLGLLKAYCMVGAEYFHAAYFNVTNIYGNYPTGTKTPNDPRGYIYQFAMPTYAQGITTRYESIFKNGSVLSAFGGVFTPSQIFVGGNRPIFVRKSNTQNTWAITGSIQRKNNCLGLIPDEDENSIDFGAGTIKFKIRRQGSTYIYDKSVTPPVFYQLDGWHENTHPSYWDKNFNFEAELHDNTGSSFLKTEVPPSTPPGDYTNFTTFVKFPNANSKIDFYFEPRNPTLAAPSNSNKKIYYVWVRARATASALGGLSSIEMKHQGLGTNNLTRRIPCIDNTGFKWYNSAVVLGPMGIGVTPTTFTISANEVYNNKITFTGNPDVEIDKFILSEVPVPANINPSEIAVVCSSSNRLIHPSTPQIDSDEELDTEVKMSMFPNPNKGQFSIVFEGLKETNNNIDVTLFNSQGELIYATKIDSNGNRDFDINTGNLLNGVYFLHVKTDTRSFNNKIVIMK